MLFKGNEQNQLKLEEVVANLSKTCCIEGIGFGPGNLQLMIIPFNTKLMLYYLLICMYSSNQKSYTSVGAREEQAFIGWIRL